MLQNCINVLCTQSKLVVIYNVMICDVLNNEMFDTEIFAFVFLNISNLSD